MSFGSRDERIRRHDEAAGLYRALEPHEVRELAAFAIGEPAPDGDRYRWYEEILLCLACLHPGSLDGPHDALLARHLVPARHLARGRPRRGLPDRRHAPRPGTRP